MKHLQIYGIFVLRKFVRNLQFYSILISLLNLKAPLLELLLKRDDLNLDEIEIWEGLLKWCFAQQNMKNDPAKWSKEDITKIERSLHIPYSSENKQPPKISNLAGIMTIFGP